MTRSVQATAIPVALPRLALPLLLTFILLPLTPPSLHAQAPPTLTPQQLITSMIDNENAASARHEFWEYLATERSGRTGYHVWTERVVETAPGRVRQLLAIDGHPLSPAQQQAERARLDQIAAHPETFIQHERGTRIEEHRARQMLEVLPRDFLFQNITLANNIWRLEFVPNPAYTPSGIEERVLHGMAGTLVIDARDLRLIHMDFHVVHEVTFGFGLLADIKPGTTFVSDRQQVDGAWHTLHVATQVRAKAAVFKNVDLDIDLQRSHFRLLPHELSVPQAVALLESPPN